MRSHDTVEPALYDTRPPPAVRFPAEPGWRLVWMLAGAFSDAGNVEVRIGVEAITYWALEAPVVVPAAPGQPPRSTLGTAVLNPLHGAMGTRLHPDARVFRIVPPSDRSTDEELSTECLKHLAFADRQRPRVVR